MLRHRHPGFEVIGPALSTLTDDSTIPAVSRLQQGLEQWPQVPTAGDGVPISFVAQQPGSSSAERSYEMRIYETGQVQTRSGDWHDLYNAAVWLTFPRSKAALNRIQYRALSAREVDSRRTPVENMATHLDESGLVVVCRDPELGQLIRDFRWSELFIDARERVLSELRLLIVGHGLFCKLRTPYIGLTGFALFVDWNGAWPESARDLHHRVDLLLAEQLQSARGPSTPRELAPVPMLGWPGWWPEQDAAFYADRHYFRGGRRR